MALISEAKREANRENARASTGPRTKEGKAAIRLNAVKHGLAAKTPVLPDEDDEGFAALLADIEARLAPQDEAEREAVRDLAESTWRKRRGFRIETIVLQALIAKEEEGELTVGDVVQIPTLLLRISRYEGQLARAYDRALARLHMLRTLNARRRPSSALREGADGAGRRSGEGQGAVPRSTPSASTRLDPRPSAPPLGGRAGEESRIPADLGFVSSSPAGPPAAKRAA